jgi:hypothetical protein
METICSAVSLASAGDAKSAANETDVTILRSKIVSPNCFGQIVFIRLELLPASG